MGHSAGREPEPDREAIEAQAARWLVERESSSWSPVDQTRLDAWLAKRTAHRIAYLRLETAWQRAALLKALAARVPSGVIPARGSWYRVRGTRASPRAERHPGSAAWSASATPRRTSKRYFATSCYVAILSAAAYLCSATLFVGTLYATPVGGIEEISLADSSEITLNTDTRIRVQLTGSERRIRLEQGEAFFDVAKDARRPFVVYVGDERVIAVGTRFAVRRDGDDIKIIVTTGSVRLAAAQSALESIRSAIDFTARSCAARAGRSSASGVADTYLAADETAETWNSRVLVRRTTPAQTERLLAWRTGYLYFDNTTLARAVAEFNRYTRRKIFISDPSIAAIRIGGHFRAANVSAFLALLRSGFPIDVQQTYDGVILTVRRPARRISNAPSSP